MPRTIVLKEHRHLPLEGSYNVRDIGGYATADGRQTRWHTIFRADSLHRLTPAAQAYLLDHGVRTIIDLRRPAELAAAPNVFATSAALRYRHQPLLDGVPGASAELADLATLYRHILDTAGPAIAAALAALAEPDALPAVVHCTAGKDRTGIVIALLLGLAGVPDATIAADYALTARYLEGDFWHEARQRAGVGAQEWARYRHILAAPPEAMLDTLGYLDERHGGVHGYLRAIGLTEAQVEALHAALVGPAAAPLVASGPDRAVEGVAG